MIRVIHLSKIFLLFFFFLVTRVSTGGEIKIVSNPVESEVYIQSGNGKSIKVGKTPFNQDLDELIQRYVKSSSFVIEVKKKGYRDYRVLFNKTSNVDIELNANLEVSNDTNKIQEYDIMIGDLFESQRLIRGKNYKDAILKLNELEKKYKQFSTIHELKGIAYYLDKDIEKSLSFFRKAFAVNPQNADAYRMKVYLEKKLNVGSSGKGEPK